MPPRTTITTRHCTRSCRRGMTAVELCIGMVVTAMVIGALGGLWLAVGEAWRSNGGAQAVAATANQANVRLEAAFRQSRLIIKSEPGSLDSTPGAESAWAFVWRGDFWNRPAQTRPNPDYATPLADAAVQIAELGLLQYDPESGKIYFYRAKDAARMTEDQRRSAGEVPTFARLLLGETRATFRRLDFVERTVIAEGVTGLLLKVPAVRPGSRPVVEYTLRLARKGAVTTWRGTAALRSPSTQPTY